MLTVDDQTRILDIRQINVIGKELVDILAGVYFVLDYVLVMVVAVDRRILIGLERNMDAQVEVGCQAGVDRRTLLDRLLSQLLVYRPKQVLEIVGVVGTVYRVLG